MLLQADPSPSLLPFCLFQSKPQKEAIKLQQMSSQKENQTKSDENIVLKLEQNKEREKRRGGDRGEEEKRRMRRASVQEPVVGGERGGEANEKGERGGQKWFGPRKGKVDVMKKSQDGEFITDAMEFSTPKETDIQTPTTSFPSLTISTPAKTQRQFRFQIATEKLFKICKNWSSTAVFSRVRFFKFYWKEREVICILEDHLKFIIFILNRICVLCYLSMMGHSFLEEKKKQEAKQRKKRGK